jgi:dihydroorotase
VSLPGIVIAGGRVIDPAQGFDAVCDLHISRGTVAADGESAQAGAEVFDASGLLVVPGLMDIHTHFFYGMTSMAVDPRIAFAEAGVTAAVDAGTSGSANFTNFRTFIIEPSPLHLYGFLNLYVLGFAGGPGDAPRHLKGMSPLDLALVDHAARVITRHRDKLVGVKLLAPREGGEFVGLTRELVGRAVEIATRSGSRVMCHIDGGDDLDASIGQLRSGDIVTHCFQGKDPNILEDSGAIRPVVAAARERGVLFDFAPADHHHFSWDVLEGAVRAGFFPDTISTDTANPVKGEAPFASMPDCMSMLLHAGMPLADVVAAATSRPAAAVGLADRHGSLAAGRAADVTILQMVEEPKTYKSMRPGEQRTTSRYLVPVATMVGGSWFFNSRQEAPATSAA